MLLLQCRHAASFPKLDNLVPSGKMKILLVFLGLLGNSTAMPMQMPRMPGFSSKSEEMMRFGQFNFMNSPHMAHLGPMYGYGMQPPQLFPQYQMPMWPQPPPNTGRPRKPSSPSTPKHQRKTDQTPETPKPNQPQPKNPSPKRPLKQPTPAPTPPQEEAQPPQAFPPFGNGIFPYQHPPWQIPHRVPPGYGRPPVSNEEGGNPYFGYFGYQGFGGRPPYYSEEMFEQDFEKPKEEDPPKTETPATEPSSNSTVPETNSTQPNAPNPGGHPGVNDTSPTGNSGPGPNTVRNPTVQNGVNPSPTVNVSGQGAPRSQIPWRPNQPNIRKIYPNPNFQNVPVGRQWRPTGTVMGHRQNGPFYRNQIQRGPRWNSYALQSKPAVRPGYPIYRKPYASTARGNSPNLAGNPANLRRKPQGPNKHPVGTNVAPLGPKLGTVGRNENIQNPGEKQLGQKERIVIPTRNPTGTQGNSQDYGVNTSNYKIPQPESNMPLPNFNSIDQRENSYYPREESRKAPNSDGQTQSQNLPKGIILEPRRIPYESETNRPELKHSTYQPVYPEEIPSPAREHFPAGRNTWKHQEIAPPFKEDPGRQEQHLPHPSHGPRGDVYYPDYNPYDPRENSPYIRSNTWDERDDSPNTMGLPEDPLYPMNTPDPKETVPYNEEDPMDPTGDEPFPEQSRWGREESSFKEGTTVRHYKDEQYTANQPKEYLPYSLDNPSKPREDFPYGEFYPWNPDENFPLYNTVPTVPPPVESRGYYANRAVGKEEDLFPSWTSWDHRIEAQRQKERRPYFNRNFWDRPINLHKAPASLPHEKKNQPYSSNFPAGLQKNPTWHEGENWNYGMQITRLNSPDNEHLAFQDLIPPSYSPGQKEAHLFHQSQRVACCAGASIGHKDNPLALQDYTPSSGLAPGENQDTSPLFTKDSHTKHARHTVSPTSNLPIQRNSSEKRQPGENQNPSPFRDDVSTLRRNTPCSIKNQLEQGVTMPFSEVSSLQSKNTPCLKNDLGGDGNNVLEQIFEGDQLSERTVDLTPEQLVIDEGPKPEGIQSEVQGNEGERQQQRPSSILQLPCFGSKLTKYHSSSTGTPSGTGRQSPFNGDSMMPTEIPDSLTGLATGTHFQSIHVDPFNADEQTPFDSLQIGTDPQDCLLLQA
ncbi:enamelin [Molossus molossus]|uniref:Enamelin n=1 Tax=Molossus molossus TaxID=27622 RepID=A0A7J8JT29_MOLMO|nr:enamelin [Molossus molossus]KAF6499918.1 enamelin [Molossus molossus]